MMDTLSIKSKLLDFLTRIMRYFSAAASQLMPLGRRLIAKLDFFCLRCWEYRQYIFPRSISHGEMTALLRRMGYQGFTEYILWQKKGGFNRTFLSDNLAETIAQLKIEFPDAAKKMVAAAEQLIQGKFQRLGSPLVDLRRKENGPGYQIDWNRDLITGDGYRRIFDFRRWPDARVRKGSPDIKGCWEIGRLQHFAVLGQAYWLTNDEKYARCYAETITDFIKKNPVGNGVQWACPMDVGLRVVSMIIGLHFFQNSRQLSFRWWQRFLISLTEHGRYLASNLEFGTLNGKIVTSNHYLSDLFGLYWLAMAFPGIDAGCVWRGLAERGLEHEVRYQMHPDGGNFESSTAYHLLVTEMLLSAYALSQKNQHPFSPEYQDTLLRALRFVKAIRQTDGRIPQIGDADSGRAHILSAYGTQPPDHADFLLAAGSAVLNCPELKEGISQSAQLESFFWPKILSQPMQLPSISSACLFKDSGVALLKNHTGYALLANTPPGTKGFSNHKHNDQLAVEWGYQGQAIFIDAGSFTYTRDPMQRNRFRSTAMHNTVKINDEEQNRFNLEFLFRMDNDCRTTLTVREEENKLIATGTHTGYKRLVSPVEHQRTLILSPSGLITIEDIFLGEGDHSLEWNFLLFPGCYAEIKDKKILLNSSQQKFYLETPPEIIWKIKDSDYSPGYGLVQKTQCLNGVFLGPIKKFTIQAMVF